MKFWSSNQRLIMIEKRKKILHTISSVARGGGRGGYSPPIGLPTKMQNKKNTTFLALLRLSFALDPTKKWFKA